MPHTDYLTIAAPNSKPKASGWRTCLSWAGTKLQPGLLLALMAIVPGALNAANVATWQDSALNVAGPVAANTGAGSVSRGSGLTYVNTGACYNSSSWTTTGAPGTDPTFNNDYVQITASTVGFTGIQLVFTDQRGTGGPQSVGVYYSTTGTGGPFTLLNTYAPVNGANSNRVTTTLPAGANHNASNLVFRLHGYNAGNGTGQLRFSAISVTGTADLTAPTCSSIVLAGASPTNASALSFTVTFSEAVTGVTAANFSKTGTLSGTGTIGVPTTTDNITWAVPVTGVTGSGTFGINKTSNAGVQDGGTLALTGGNVVGSLYTVDQTAPTCVSIVRADANPTGASTLNFTVTFSEAVTNVIAARFAKSGTLSATGTIGTPTTTDNITWNVPVTGMSGNGTLGLNKTSNTGVTDSAGNALGGGTVTGELYTVITVERYFVVDSNDDEVYRYSQSFLLTGNWDTNGSGAATPQDVAATATNAYVLDSDDERVYQFAYSGGTGTASRQLRDAGGAQLGASITAVAIYGDELWLGSDSDDLLLQYSLTQAFTGATSYNAINDWGLDTGDGNNQCQGMAVDATFVYVLDQADNRFYRYQKSNPGAGATAGRHLMDVTGAAEVANPNGAALVGTTMYVVDDNNNAVYTYALASLFTSTADLNALSVSNLDANNGNPAGIAVIPDPSVLSINRAGASPTGLAQVTFTVTFSEAVTGVDATDFALATTGVTGASIASVSADTGNVRTVTVNTGTGDGTIGLNFVDDDTVRNGSNIAVGGAGTGNANFTGQVYTIDKSVPTITSINRTNASPTNSTNLSFTVTFSEAVTGLTAANFTKTGSLAASGTIGTPTTANGGITWTIVVSGVSGSGTLGIDKTSNSGVQDAGGNALTGGNVVGQQYTVDTVAPTCLSIARTDASPTAATTLNFTVTFSEAVTGLTAARFVKTGTLSGVGTIGTPTTSDGGITWNVAVTGVTGNGTLGLSKTTNTGVADSAGNALTGGTVTVPAPYTIDQAAPTCVSINRTNSSPTNSTSLSFTVTFSEAVTGVTASNFTKTGGLAATGTIGTPTTSDNITWTVVVSGVSGNGTLGLNKTSNTGVQDGIGNSMTGGNVTGQLYQVDNVAPTVSSINRTNPSPTNSTSLSFTVTFSEAVTGLTASNFTKTGSIAASGTIGTPTTANGGLTWTILVTGVSGSGTLGIDKTSNAGVQDLSGNALSGSNFVGQQYTVDNVGPTCSSISRADANPTSATTLNFTVVFSEAATGVTAANFTKSGTLSGTGTIGTCTTSDGGITWNVVVTGVYGTGTFGINKTSNAGVTDAATNAMTGGNVTGALYDISNGIRYFVSEFLISRIYTYSENFAPRNDVDVAGSAIFPPDIVATNEFVYIYDQLNRRLRRFSYTGTLIASSRPLRDTAGADVGLSCRGLAIDGDAVWIGDNTNSRVYRYSLAAAFSAGGNYSAIEQANLNGVAGNTRCDGMTLDATFLYVLDLTDQRFYRYTRASLATTPVASKLLKTTGGADVTDGVGCLLDGNIMYVVDDNTNVELEYDPSALFSAGTTVNATTSHSLLAANNSPSGIALNPIPAVNSIVRAGANPTSASLVTFTVTFSESVTGVDGSDFALAMTGVSGAFVSSVSADTGSTRTVVVNTGTGDGTVGLNFADNDTVVDIGGLPIGGSGAGNGNLTGQVYTIDKTPPSCFIIRSIPASPYTNLTAVTYWVGFSEPVTGVVAGNFELEINNLAGTPTIGTPTTSDGGITWNVTITGIAALQPVGSLKLNLTNNLSSISDQAFNHPSAESGETYTFDQSSPECVSITLADPNPTNATELNFTVLFNEPVTNVTDENFTMTGTLAGGASVTFPTTNDGGLTWNVQVTGVNGRGTLGFSKTNNTDVIDEFGYFLSGPDVTSALYDVDQTNPASSSYVADSTRAGTTTLEIAFTASDIGGVGVASTSLYVKGPADSSFIDSGLTQPGTAGSFMYAITGGNGLYRFATRATDSATNVEAAPISDSSYVLLNTVENGAFVQTAVTGEDHLLFPMTDDLDVSVTLSAATPSGTVTVARSKPRATTPSYFHGVMSELLDESITVTASGLGAFSADLDWPYDSAGAPTIDNVYKFDGGATPSAVIPVTPSGNVISLVGLTSFSDFYAGNAVAVPVTLSGFSID